MRVIGFFFKAWRNWKRERFTFWEAYEWQKLLFTVNEAKEWRDGVRKVNKYFDCSAELAYYGRLFNLTPQQVVESVMKYLARAMAKPLAIHLDYSGVMRTTTEAPIGLATADSIPIFDPDLDTEEADNGHKV
jgi:hypothetical protein